MASIEFLLVNFQLSVDSSLKLTDISLISEVLDGGEQQILDIDDRFANTISNLFRNFDPAIRTMFSESDQILVTRQICVSLQILLERIL